jgi:hypothetical protein
MKHVLQTITVTITVLLLMSLCIETLALAAKDASADLDAIGSVIGSSGTGSLVNSTPEAQGTLFALLLSALAAHQFAAATILIVMLVIGFVRFSLSDAIPTWLLPWLSMITGILANSLLVLNGGKLGTDTLLTGLGAGLMASGCYSAAGRHLVSWISKIKSKAVK